MKKIFEMVGSPKFPPGAGEGPLIDNETLLGVEVETENTKRPKEFFKKLKYWMLTIDGSLKSPFPYEFVFCGPLRGHDVVAALKELEHVLTEETSVEFPHNTSVHVHMNVGDLSCEELKRFIYLCMVVESALIQVSGNRRNNGFIVPWSCHSPKSLGDIGTFLETEGQHNMGVNKYNTFNLGSVYEHGSVEFRTMKGTCSSLEILDWIDILLKLKKYCIENTVDPRDIMDYSTSRSSVKEFLLQVWDVDIVKRMMHPGIQESMLHNSFVARLALFPKPAMELETWLVEQIQERLPPNRRKALTKKYEGPPVVKPKGRGKKIKHFEYTTSSTGTSIAGFQWSQQDSLADSIEELLTPTAIHEDINEDLE